MAGLMLDLAPLREDRTFRNLFVGRTILLFGVGVVAVTVPLEVYERTGSTPVVGLVSAVESIAFLVGFLGGGVLADRVDRWRLTKVTWALSGVSFALLAVNAALWSSTTLTALFVATNGLSGSVCLTAMLAVMPSIVDRSKLHAVGALNTVSLRLGSVVAPVVGGLTFALASAAWNYAAGALVAAVTWVLLAVSPVPGTGGVGAAGPGGSTPSIPETDPTPSTAPTPSPPTEPAEPVRPAQPTDPADVTPAEGPLQALRSGARFVVGDPVVLGVLVAGLVGMLGGGSIVLVPALVAAKFGGAPTAVGLIYAALAVGLVGGSLVSGWVRKHSRPGSLLLALMVVCFALFALAGAAPVLSLTLLALVAAGATNALEEVLRYALLQLRTPDAMLGRVNSLFSAQAMGGAAVGAVVAGAVGGLVGDADALWIYNVAVGLLAVVVSVLLRPLRAATRTSVEERVG